MTVSSGVAQANTPSIFLVERPKTGLSILSATAIAALAEFTGTAFLAWPIPVRITVSRQGFYLPDDRDLHGGDAGG